jgi:hypothetical protein
MSTTVTTILNDINPTDEVYKYPQWLIVLISLLSIGIIIGLMIFLVNSVKKYIYDSSKYRVYPLYS